LKKILWFTGFLIIAILVYTGYEIIFSTPEIKVIKTARVEKTDIRSVLVETGIIKLQVGAKIKIGARATGEIIKMGVKIGSKVKK